VPSDKRQRQREGRQQAQQQMQAQRKRASRQRTIVMLVVLGLLFAGFLGLSGRGKSKKKGDNPVVSQKAASCPNADGSSPKTTKFPAAPGLCINPTKKYTAEMKTNKGTMTIELDAKKAPKTVNNFVYLSRYHYYDGVSFHRIIPGFVVQGGDPLGTGAGDPGYKFADELPKAGQYEVGSLAMANAGPNTNGSQFFIIVGDQGVQLPPKYSLFGKVTSGIEVAKALEAVGSEGAGTPKEPVQMDSVTITES
jgi:peptidylprolyl isomerase/peptidyl-prolyl cis-trans isomerase B (cyclophilin B)